MSALFSCIFLYKCLQTSCLENFSAHFSFISYRSWCWKKLYSGNAFVFLFIVFVWSLRSIGCIIHFTCVAPLYGSYISVKWGDISGWWITMLGSGLWLSWRWVWMVDMSAFHGALSEMVHKPGLCALIHKHLQWKWCMCSCPLMWANFFLMSFEPWILLVVLKKNKTNAHCTFLESKIPDKHMQ